MLKGSSNTGMIEMPVIASLNLFGKQVLILLPYDTNKLQAVWQGPYKVTRKVSPVDYEVDTWKKRKNLLRKWHVPEATC